jgi:hypothetical protein
MNTRWLTPLALALLASGALAQTRINEIRIDQTGADNDEYFELFGTPNDSLTGLTYLVLGDGTGGSGVIESVTDLTGQTLDANGYFVCAETTFTLGVANYTPAGSNPLNYENSDTVTHMLVSGFSGLNGDDLDTNDDGVLDVLPWTGVLDSLALTPSPQTEFPYSTTIVGPDGTFVPGHVYYCDFGWQIGPFEPIGGLDTPGADNPCDTGGPSAFCNDVDGANASCPCANPGVPGAGCDNAGGTGGVTLGVGEFTPDGLGGGTAVLVGTGYPPAAFPTFVVMRSTSQQAPAAFGDGLLCLQPPVVRVGSGTAVGGSGAVSLNHGAGAGDFHYQAWYRSTPASYCDPLAAFNMSSGMTLPW